jgi:hypothetical protein
MRSITQIQEELRSGEGNILDLTDEEVDGLTDGDVEALQAEFGAHVLMKLPPRERAFMAWLKQEDPGIYEDLWEDDEELLVSLSFLGDFRKGGPGFTICELAFHDNYFFTRKHIKPTGLEEVPAILDRAQKGRELNIGEVFMFELLQAPIDLWHFCHRYGVPVQRGREVIRELVAHEWIVHLKRSEELAPYLEE